jgi:hypothetical protein
MDSLDRQTQEIDWINVSHVGVPKRMDVDKFYRLHMLPTFVAAIKAQGVQIQNS